MNPAPSKLTMLRGPGPAKAIFNRPGYIFNFVQRIFFYRPELVSTPANDILLYLHKSIGVVGQLEKTQNVLKCSILEHFLNWKSITRHPKLVYTQKGGRVRSDDTRGNYLHREAAHLPSSTQNPRANIT
ncbi:hypothetical protein OUZ56_016668 [Daphnia magna]|uniref:Uncharacterized protein n=1 Tax=Daphnia magna TaxID=35525 RepID=A0ABR0AR81_9CRUS|nr:hypothetical protein OUZ56_016668 [Daphnia magna]